MPPNFVEDPDRSPTEEEIEIRRLLQDAAYSHDHGEEGDLTSELSQDADR